MTYMRAAKLEAAAVPDLRLGEVAEIVSDVLNHPKREPIYHCWSKLEQSHLSKDAVRFDLWHSIARTLIMQNYESHIDFIKGFKKNRLRYLPWRRLFPNTAGVIAELIHDVEEARQVRGFVGEEIGSPWTGPADTSGAGSSNNGARVDIVSGQIGR